MNAHTILGGKVHVYRRENSRHWQCATYLAGKNRRVSTKEDSLAKAKDFAEDWYLELRGKARAGELSRREDLPRGRRAIRARIPDHHRGPAQRRVRQGPQHAPAGPPAALLRQHGAFRDHARQGAGVPHPSPREGDEGARQAAGAEHASTRKSSPCGRRSRPPCATAGWTGCPDLSEPYRASGKISHRAWFSPEEYKKLYEATRERAHDIRRTRATSGNPSSFTTTCCSWPIPACGRTRRAALNTAT